jgi:ribosomal protein S18 acetylase RimI-like enzyme
MDILHRGNLRKKASPYSLGILNVAYLDQILNLQQLIELTVPKNIFVPDTKEALEKSLSENDILLGVSIDDTLIAYRYISFPGSSDSNIGKDAGIKDKELKKVAQFETSIVHPDFRGEKLQRLMLEKGIDIVKDRGYKYGVATVSPQNPYSLKNLLDTGFKVVKTMKKYGTGEDSVLRHIMLNEFKTNVIENYKQRLDKGKSKDVRFMEYSINRFDRYDPFI